jgi:hypothetical protein
LPVTTGQRTERDVRRRRFTTFATRERTVVLLLAILLGAAIGGAARAVAPRRMPRRFDVATILAAVGAALGTLGYIISSAVWSLQFSTGILAAAAAGAIVILIAYALLPVLAPSITRALPGRSSTPSPS